MGFILLGTHIIQEENSSFHFRVNTIDTVLNAPVSMHLLSGTGASGNISMHVYFLKHEWTFSYMFPSEDAPPGTCRDLHQCFNTYLNPQQCFLAYTIILSQTYIDIQQCLNA